MVVALTGQRLFGKNFKKKGFMEEKVAKKTFESPYAHMVGYRTFPERLRLNVFTWKLSIGASSPLCLNM